jgi:hypothetical protein
MMVIVPGGAPVVASVAVFPDPSTLPALELYEYFRGRFWGLIPKAVIVAESPGFTELGLALQEMVGGSNCFTMKLVEHVADSPGRGPMATVPLTV